jgi:hypothetical protein
LKSKIVSIDSSATPFLSRPMQACTTAFEGVYVLDLLGFGLRGGRQQKLLQHCSDAAKCRKLRRVM